VNNGSLLKKDSSQWSELVSEPYKMGPTIAPAKSGIDFLRKKHGHMFKNINPFRLHRYVRSCEIYEQSISISVACAFQKGNNLFESLSDSTRL
jgi:hypothetical protein